jgi:hypothetical protein
MAGQFAGQSFGVLQRLGGLDLELGADAALDDFVERRGAVGRLPQDGGRLVQSEERGIPAGHNHHFAVETAGRDPRIACHIKPAHPINSQTRASGTKVRRETGTRLTNSKAE